MDKNDSMFADAPARVAAVRAWEDRGWPKNMDSMLGVAIDAYIDALGWEFAAIPIDSFGGEWAQRPEVEVDELIAAHADPTHWINEPHNADIGKVVGKKLVRRRPAGQWEEFE